ncbi:unnamed protein product [Clavelina lepadiformis]|uniref:AP-1 complex-associated regulatory protein n=1 Tax=Clavelina lepadiformis TaxID=159417 RepID=A0ABP0F8M2_CLALP
MEQCLGCLGILFGTRNRRRRLRHLIKYKDDSERQLGVEFENLILDDSSKTNYGTDMQFITQEEKEYLSKRQYDKIIEQQRKIDEQIDKKLFEEEEQVRIEEDAYLEAEKEAERAASNTQKSTDANHSSGSAGDRRSLTLEEVEEDFEDFLEEVRSRSIAFRSQYSNKKSDAQDPPPSFDRGVDGMSSDDEFTMIEATQASVHNNANGLEWDSYTSGVHHSKMEFHKHSPLEKRLEPVGVGGGNELHIYNKPIDSQHPLDKRQEAERMFSITDDEEDMGDFVHA